MSSLQELFARSAQRLVLLEWLLLRAQFEGDAKRLQQLQHLQEQERIQSLGHLDFLQDNPPLMRENLRGGTADLDVFLHHQNDKTQSNSAVFLRLRHPRKSGIW